MADSFRTQEEILGLATLDSEYEEFMRSRDKMGAMGDPIGPVREAMGAAFAGKLAKPAEGVSAKTASVLIPDGSSIPVTIWSPAELSVNSSNKPRPLIVMIHGGGFIVGNSLMDAPEAETLVKKHSAVCLSIDYRLAPENPFPGPALDCWEVLKWATKSPKLLTDLGVDLAAAGFALMGTSSGANLATAITYLARDEALEPKLDGVLLRMPSYLSPESVPEQYREQYLSWEQCRDADGLPVATIDFFQDKHKPDYSSPLYSPFASPKGHDGLPPICLQVCGYDPLRDDGLIYARALSEAGQRVECHVYKGLPHGYFAYYPQLSASTRLREDSVKALSDFLNKSTIK